MTVAHRTSQVTDFEILKSAQSVLQREAAALQRLADHPPIELIAAVDLVLERDGCVMVTGMGKAGWIGQKIAASFSSTGTRSHFLHPAEAIHGDLGRIGGDDVVLALSNSGETDELLRVLPHLKRLARGLIAVTGRGNSTLAREADVILDYGAAPEACHLGLAPSTSTLLMLALGDALALVCSQRRQFQAIDFARYHPGGALGRQLASVDEIMRPIERCRVAHFSENVRSIYVRSSVAERRVGVILVVDDAGALVGLFTDSDLARLLERKRDHSLDQPIEHVMSPRPKTIRSGSRTSIAIETMAGHNISELPVVDHSDCPVGIIDITDVISLFPADLAGRDQTDHASHGSDLAGDKYLQQLVQP